MAEKIELFDITMNFEQAVKDAERLKTEIVKLKEETDRLKKEQGETSKAYIQSNATLKAAQAELKTHETLIQKTIGSQRAQKGSIEQVRLELAAVSVAWAKEAKASGENSARAKELAAAKLKLTEALKSEEKATGDTRRNVGNYAEGMKEATGMIGRFIPGLGNASNAVKAFGLALNLSLLPITAIVAAVLALITYFKRTEEGQNNLNKIMKVFGVILNNIMDIVAKVGEALYKAVMEPKKVWQDFKDFIHGVGVFFKETFGNIIGGSIDVFVAWLEKGFAKVGLAWQKLKDVFVDNSVKVAGAEEKIVAANKKIEEGQARVKEGAENLKAGVVAAYDKIKSKIGEVVAETQREIAIAQKLADMQAALNKRLRAEMINDAKDEAKIAELREKAAEKNKYNAEERLKMMDEVVELQRKMLADDLGIAQTKAYIHGQEIEMRGATKEMLDEQAQLEAEVFRVQQRNFEAEKSFQMQRQTALREIAEDAVKALEAETNAYLEANKQKLIDYQRLFELQEAALSESLARNLITQTEYDTQIAKIKADNAEAERIRNIERIKTNYDNDLAIAEDSIFGQLDVQKKQNDFKRAEEIQAAEKIGASVKKINEKYDKADRALEKARMSAKLELAAGFAGNIAEIAGKETAIGKAAAVAETSINTFKSATGAFSGMVSAVPGPVGIALGIAAAAAAVAMGLANVKQILSVKSGLPGDSGGGGSSISGSGGGTQAATVVRNVVNPEIGQGIISRSTLDMTDQLAQGVQKGMENAKLQPTQVIDDVTSKQIKTASQKQMQNI
jgi:hypothetical protein